MTLEEKIALLQKAVKEQRLVQFDYVSKHFDVSYCRQVLPKAIHEDKLFAEDVKKGGEDRQFGLDGIQQLELIEICPDPNLEDEKKP